MEEKVVRFANENKNFVLSKYLLFGYRVKEEKKSLLFSTITFVREEKPINKELDQLEPQYKDMRFVPFIEIISGGVLAFLLVTALLIVFLANRSTAKAIWPFLIIPAGVLLIVSFLLTFLRLKQVDKLPLKQKEIEKEILPRINKIKEKRD